VPWTSRGGGVVINDLLKSGQSENAYLRILPDLAGAARRRGAVLSLGASFRSATILDAGDECQRFEIAQQIRLADELRALGVAAIIESPGHARPRDLERIADQLAPSGHPVMPPSPTPTDAAIGQDHIAAAIGAIIFGRRGCAAIIAAVTREEHTGGVPAIESTIEAVLAARVAARILDLDLLNDDALDRKIATRRAESHTCVADRVRPGCSRCGPTCPLHWHGRP
jgi:phosphomethylpyrimidine synthase